MHSIVVRSIVVAEGELEDRCLSREVEEQALKRQEVMGDQMVSWEAKEVEVYQSEELHEQALSNLVEEVLFEVVVVELLLCLV